jgi:hypothetical protein
MKMKMRISIKIRMIVVLKAKAQERNEEERHIFNSYHKQRKRHIRTILLTAMCQTLARAFREPLEQFSFFKE